MRHHFGDFLDRDGDYWTVIPNRDRYTYRIGGVSAGSPDVTIVTVGKEDDKWSRVLTLPNLEELTLHDPTPEQLLACGELRGLKRLRITHARPKTLDFVRTLTQLEELVLEYVSGFSDLTPIGRLPLLRALHLENLRRVSNFSGLSGAAKLKYLAVYGTADWKQPVENWEFLDDLPGLEVIRLWQVICRAGFPATLPFMGLRRLRKLRLHPSNLAAEEYALLEEGLPDVDGACWGPYRVVADSFVELPKDDIRARLPEDIILARHPEVRIWHGGRRVVEDPASRWFEFTGKGAGRIKCSSSAASARCRDYEERYIAMRARARGLLNERCIAG